MIDIRKLPNLNTEQTKLVSDFYRLFNYAAPGSGLNRNFANVEPLVFEGAVLGSEFLTYAATKLYLCFDIVYGSSLIAGVVQKYVEHYNENNVLFGNLKKESIGYDQVAVVTNYIGNNVNVKNFYFGRNASVNYNYMKFIGYRITLD